MWQLNMVFCIAVGFGSFAWALKRTMDAEKMKKGDAASHAEQWLSGTRWVPGWMQSLDAATPEEAASTPDTDEPTSHAA